jgi:hypothetical protein
LVQAGAVGNAQPLSTASWPVPEAHRPQIHSLRASSGTPGAPTAQAGFGGKTRLE